MTAKKIGLASCVVVVIGALLWGNAPKETPSGLKITEAAQAFLKTLNEDQRKQASFDYHSKERLNWHYIPRERKGLPLKDLEGDALKAAHKLISSSLSEAGYSQALNVMSLEELLYLLEKGDREYRRSRRDPAKYYISIFGTPKVKGTWGWRIEGHHLSLNYTITDGQVVASTPEFFGANPALVDAGPKRKIRVLGPEEDIARQILLLCNKQQEKLAYRSPKAPNDIRSRGTLQPETTPAVGLPASKMSTAQKKLLAQLLNEYLQNMPADVERERRAKIEEAGIDKIHFAWWGSKEVNQRHAYRLQGPTFLVEYNNTQNDANHLHTVWRNMAGDFNLPIKK
ncbi:MAG: DUF3500 domain-containing protein [Planctomycetaceae bacterium]